MIDAKKWRSKKTVRNRHVQETTCYFHFFGPLRSETNRVLLFHTRDLLPELVLFLEHFLDHFLLDHLLRAFLSSPLIGHTPFSGTQITVLVRFSGPRFWMRFWTFLVTVFGCQIRIRNWQFWGLKIDEWKMSQKRLNNGWQMTQKGGAQKQPKNDEKWTKKNEITSPYFHIPRYYSLGRWCYSLGARGGEYQKKV